MNQSSYRKPIRPWMLTEVVSVIEKCIAMNGMVKRRDLMDAFHISEVTASRYMNAYKEHKPDTLRYDPHRKAYVPVWQEAARLVGKVTHAMVYKEVMTTVTWLMAEHKNLCDFIGVNPAEVQSNFSNTALMLNQCITEAKVGNN